MIDENNKINSGINRNDVEKILVNFLKNENLKVLAIKGKWGVGKTYLVQTVLESNSKQFYYGSVFGISSLEQLKAQILVNIHDESSGLTNQTSLPRSIAKILGWTNKKSQQVAKVPKLIDFPISGAVISIAGDLLLNSLFRTIKNTIVCIDDLERKSIDLSLNELLGFVDFLIRESQSKIILIYNEERLIQDKSSEKDLEDYREKIIDVEVSLEPTVEENVNLIFKDDPDRTIIQETSKITSTKNIRILRKVQWVLNQLRPLANKWHPSLRSQLIRNIIVLALAKFDTEFPIKTEAIVCSNDPLSYLNNRNQEFLEELIKNSSLLSEFGYKHLDLDKQIIKLIETSLFDREEFISQGNFLNEIVENHNILQKFRELWIPYSNSFGKNERNISDNIIQFLQAYHLKLSIEELEELEKLALAVEVDISSYKKALLEQLISSTEDIDFLRILRNKVSPFPDLVDCLDEKISAWMSQQNITVVLSKIVKKNGWSHAEAEFLNSRTVAAQSMIIMNGFKKRILTYAN